jgi:hypothetical protein
VRGDRWSDPPGDWLDEDTPRHSGRSRRLLVLAGLPWLVVLAVVVLPAGGPGADRPEPDAGPGHAPGDAGAGTHEGHGSPQPEPGSHGTAGPAEEPSTPAAEPEGAPEPGPRVSAPETDGGPDPAPPDGAGAVPLPAAADDDWWLVEQRGRWRVAAGTEEAAAMAVVVARAWLTDLDPRLTLDAIPPAGAGRYVEHLVVEAVEVPLDGHAVVTLLAVLLASEADGDDLVAQVRRLAVPVAFDGDGARPGGSPWWLPGPSLEARPPTVTPVDDPDERLAAAEALVAAGYDEVSLERLERTAGPAVLATVSARTPDGEPIDGTVWLRRHVERYVVAGTVLARADGPAREATP